MTKRKATQKSSDKAKVAAKPTQTSASGPAAGGSAANRSRTRERRMERQRQKQQQQRLLIAAGIGVGAVLILVLVILATQPASAPIPDGTEARYAGIPQTVTEDGWYRLGRPDAPVRIEEFSSFACPGCADFNADHMDGVIDLLVEGKASFTFIPQTNAGATANNAARAAICAGQQGMFFEYHDALFEWLRRFGNQAFSQNRLVTGAENLGLNVSEFESCLSGNESRAIVDAAVEEGQARGIPGTPSTFVQGVEVSSDAQSITTAVDNALVGVSVPIIPIDRDSADAGSSGVEATPEATAEAEVTAEPGE